jgi:hypothetical protein
MEDPEMVASLRAFLVLGKAVEDRRRGIGIGALARGRREGEFRMANEDGGCDERNPCGILTDLRLTMQSGLGVGSTSSSGDGRLAVSVRARDKRERGLSLEYIELVSLWPSWEFSMLQIVLYGAAGNEARINRQ